MCPKKVFLLNVLLILSLSACSYSVPTSSAPSAVINEQLEETQIETAGSSYGKTGTKAAKDQSDQTFSTYRTLYSSEVSTLNYLVTSSANDYAITANIVDSLVDYDQFGNIVPGLALKWESNDDATVWTFHIRPDVKWVDKDGNPVADVTADDWVAAAEYVNNAANGSSTQYMYNTGAVVRNAQAYYRYTAYLVESENGTRTEDEEGNPIEPADPVLPDEIGVSAADDHTLIYTLDQPCPFFPSVLTYTSYLPVNRAFLETSGDMFGIDNDHLLYNGAYLVSAYEPQEKRVLVKNPLYWDAGHVYINEIVNTYNAEASTLEPVMYLNGEVDTALISTDILAAWLEDESTKDLVHGSRPDTSFSYFYAFNFDPQFDAEYEPANWTIAVNNENFRHAVMAALDRRKALAVQEPYHPEILMNNTVTPKAFATSGGKDFTDYAPLADITARDSYDPESAVAYRDAAIKELKDAGATFPVKVLMPYNPSTVNWDRECQIVEQQIEGVLGSDFIDIIIQAGPETGFLSAIRRSGNYAFMKCNWGADYADPQTWSEPFSDGNSYNFWYKSENPDVQKLFAEYTAAVEKASAIYNDDPARYEAFAKAEAMLIEHAVVVPFSIFPGKGYLASNINFLEGEYAPYGMANFRYKYLKLHDSSMSMDEFSEALSSWEEERTRSLK